jgi:hypothetical protein
MDFSVLIASMFLSSVGSFLDHYTTQVVVRAGGLELEANEIARKAMSSGRFKTMLFLEALGIVALGIMDSFEVVGTSFFAGLVFLTSRGLVASSNLRAIVQYRAIGMSAYLEQERLRMQVLQKVPPMNRVGLVLVNIVVSCICLFVYLALLSIDFPLALMTRSLVFGSLAYFVAISFHTLRSIK